MSRFEIGSIAYGVAAWIFSMPPLKQCLTRSLSTRGAFWFFTPTVAFGSEPYSAFSSFSCSVLA